MQYIRTYLQAKILLLSYISTLTFKDMQMVHRNITWRGIVPKLKLYTHKWCLSALVY